MLFKTVLQLKMHMQNMKGLMYRHTAMFPAGVASTCTATPGSNAGVSLQNTHSAYNGAANTAARSAGAESNNMHSWHGLSTIATAPCSKVTVARMAKCDGAVQTTACYRVAGHSRTSVCVCVCVVRRMFWSAHSCSHAQAVYMCDMQVSLKSLTQWLWKPAEPKAQCVISSCCHTINTLGSPLMPKRSCMHKCSSAPVQCAAWCLIASWQWLACFALL